MSGSTPTKVRAATGRLRRRCRRAVAEIAWHRYPQRSASELRSRIGANYGLSASQVFAANGSNEVLQTLLLTFAGPGRSAAVFEPTYALHSHLSRITGTAVIEGERNDDFSLDLDEVERVIVEHRPDVVFLCSPNNPTGVVDPEASIRRVLELTAANGGLLCVDEAYGQFADFLPSRCSATTPRSSSVAPIPRLGRWQPFVSATSSPRRGSSTSWRRSSSRITSTP